jgi:UDP-N-acetylmuramate dehydrogenase
MNMAETTRTLGGALRGDLRRDEPMRKHTSWRVGGTADCAYVPADLEDLCAFLAGLPANEPLYPVGLGSNLLVRDGGIRGTVVFMHRGLRTLLLHQDSQGGRLVYAQAGVASPKVARFAANQGLEGAEFLAGVPGTVGGALAMNAGCYGSETWDVVECVMTVDRGGRLRMRRPRDYEIGYRHCRRKDAGEAEWFGAAWLRLRPGDGEASRMRIRDLLTRRISSQPLDRPNAGSVFRNPPGDHAARLIESCGLKGCTIGGAQVSTKHANFIVNTGAASAADIEQLMEHVRATVARETGVVLVREVLVVGETG